MDFNNSFFDELSRSAPVANLCTGIAEEIAADIRKTGPEDSGDYLAGISVASKFQRRFVALVIASDPKSLLVEARNGTMVRALNRAKKRGRA